MNRFFAVWLSAVFLVASCNNNKSKDEPAKQPERTDKEAVDRTKNGLLDLEKQQEELGKLSPLGADLLKARVPEKLLGAQRTLHEVSDAMGTNVASGEYEINDSLRIVLNIYDCAGPAGAGIYNLQFAGLLNNLHDNADEYIKSIDLNGNKAFEQCDKTTNDCTISFFTGGRFMVTLSGDHAGADILKQAAGELKIK